MIYFKIHYFIILFAIVVNCEKFCDKDRKLLLGGVFSYDKTVYAYSWKEGKGAQLWLVWKFETKGSELEEIGSSSNVDQVFPGIPLFRAGFGFNCDQTKCKTYKDLVFIFFQNGYKTFRHSGGKFSPESDAGGLPWGLKPIGDVSVWFFGTPNMDNVNAISFSAENMKIFLVSKNVLYSSDVNFSEKGLKWTKINENPQLLNALGGFMSGTDIFINKNESPDNVLLKYDTNGVLLNRISVWKHFKCDSAVEDKKGVPFGGINSVAQEENESTEDNNKSLATILIAVIVVLIIITNIVSAIFWTSVYYKK